MSFASKGIGVGARAVLTVPFFGKAREGGRGDGYSPENKQTNGTGEPREEETVKTKTRVQEVQRRIKMGEYVEASEEEI